ncbi:cobalamin B12-binding domain-containing protein [Paenibacillus glycinis]|uniref:Cobalamin-binding protein n=1 Tax=Paenibacillus glycinis TaxID=2697035 RepID=A0ABW9XPC6_9BACL|nr:cobalamin-dependent protein [Paenibacillus glycinis]NBD24480.1 cobalamin-binding protein [Paenibacillus glycinis]
MQMEIEWFAEQLISGSIESCWEKLLRFMDAGANSLFIYEQVLTSAMRYIGSLWEQNLISVADEHLASGLCDILITRYGMAVNQAPANGLKAMFLCVEGETHDLGLKIVGALFREHGWDTRSYGVGLPLELAVASGMNWRPDVIGLSVSMAANLPAARTYEESLAELFHGPTIMIGGRQAGAYAALRQSSERLVLATSLLDVGEWLRARQTDMPRRRSAGKS